MGVGPPRPAGLSPELTRGNLPVNDGVPGWLSCLSVCLLISAQVTISQFVRLSPTLGSTLGTKTMAWDLCVPCISGSSEDKSLNLGKIWSTWVAQSVEWPTLDFGSGHDPRAVGSSPGSGSELILEPV